MFVDACSVDHDLVRFIGDAQTIRDNRTFELKGATMSEGVRKKPAKTQRTLPPRRAASTRHAATNQLNNNNDAMDVFGSPKRQKNDGKIWLRLTLFRVRDRFACSLARSHRSPVIACGESHDSARVCLELEILFQSTPPSVDCSSARGCDFLMFGRVLYSASTCGNRRTNR